MKISLNVISDVNKLSDIEVLWNKFINRCSKNPFFLSGFVKQFIEYDHSKGNVPYIIVLSVDNIIVGMVPLIIKNKFGLRFAEFLLKPWLSPDFIVYKQYREICIDHILDFLFKTLRCQFINLSFPAESPNLQILKHKCKVKKIYYSTKQEMGHCIIPIKCTWDEFKKMRGGNFRRRIRRLERNLDRAGSWRILYVESKYITLDHVKNIIDIEKRSWKQLYRKQHGIKIDQDLLMTLKCSQYMSKIEPRFKWYVWFLELNDHTLAYTLVIQYKETAYICKTSYDKKHKKFYPGIYINNAAICDAFNKRQIRNIDWLTDLPFHRNWTSICLPRIRIIMAHKIITPVMKGLIIITDILLKNQYIRNIIREHINRAD